MAVNILIVAMIFTATLTVTAAYWHGDWDWSLESITAEPLPEEGSDVGSGADPIDYIRSSDFEIEEIIDMANLDGLVNLEEKEDQSPEAVGKMFGLDMLEMSKEFAHHTKDFGRSVPIVSKTTDCGTFCLQFYNWCKDAVCFELIKDPAIGVIEMLPCLTTCTVHAASCCFS